MNKKLLSASLLFIIAILFSGKVAAQTPTINSSAVVTVGVSTSSVSINWTSGNGSKRIVTCALATSSVALPTNGSTYTQNSTFGAGSNLGSGNYCIYNGTANGCNAFGLAAATSYKFRIYEYNTSGFPLTEYYLTSGYPIYTEITLSTEPTTSCSGLTFSGITASSADLSFVSGSGTNDLVALRSSTSYTNVPVDASVYTANTNYGSGSSIAGTIPYSYVLSNGTSTSFTTTGLAAGTIYTAAAFPFNGSGGSQNYKTTSYPTTTFSTLAQEPTSASYYLTFSNVTSTSLTLDWTPGNGTYHLVTCKPGTTNSDLPLDATNYSASSSYGFGSQIGGAAGAYVVYNGTGHYVNVSNLSPLTTYCFSIYEWNVASNTYNLTYNYYTYSYSSAIQAMPQTEPTVGASALTFSSITPNSFRATWANGNGSRRVAAVAAGRKPTALAFDGTNDYISIPNESNFDFTSQMSVEAWVKIPAWTVAYQAVVTKGDNSWRISRYASSSVLEFSCTIGGVNYSAVGARNVADGKWHHIAGTYNGSQMILYVDGGYDGHYNVSGSIDNSSYAVYIGENAQITGRYFNGQIDEVRVWSTPLSWSQINQNMNRTLVGNEYGLKGYWKLNDGFVATSSALNSAFTPGINGTLNNFVTTAATGFSSTSGWLYSTARVNMPIDLQYYTDNTAFMSSTASSLYYGNLYYSVYRGPDSSSVTVTNLSPGTYYTMQVFDYSGVTGDNNYYTDSYALNEVLTTSVTAPTITSFSPMFGFVGSIVTINGTGFNTTAANNTVYFGAAKASVLSVNGSGTIMTVKVPAGSTYERISVTTNTLTAYSTKPFVVTSPCGSTTFSAATFNAGVGVSTYYPQDIHIADMDQDGLSDLVGIYQYGYTTITRNTSAGGTIGLAGAAYFGTAYINTTDMDVADMDGDGKLDVVMNNNYSTAQPTILIQRNTSTPGAVSLLSQIEFAAYPGYAITDIAIADITGDGKPDVIAVHNNQIVSVYKNSSSFGNISFSGRNDFVMPVGTMTNSVATGDIDGDGKIDLAVAGGSGSTIQYLRNISTTGTVNFTVSSTTLSGTITGVEIADIDNDTKPEIIYGASSSSAGILKNNSTSGTITISASPTMMTTLANTPVDFKAGDIDGDGKVDISVSYSSGTQVSIFKNVSVATPSMNTKFDFTLAGGTSYPYSVALCDMNNDSKLDLLSSTTGYSASYFQNGINPLVAEPTVQASALNYTGVTTTQITCNFTPGNGANKVVFVRPSGAPAFVPTDGVSYVPNTLFGAGADLGGGNYCVMDGNASGVTVTGLLSNTPYIFSVYEYNGVTNCTYNYLTSGTTNSSTQWTLNNAPTLNTISNPSSICQGSGLQTINLSGIGTGALNETQTLVVTATSSNTGLIPTPSVSYTSPSATGTVSYTPVPGMAGTAIITVTVNDGATNNATIQRTFTVTVDNTPTVSVAGPNQAVCPGVATLAGNTPTFGTGTWTRTATTNPGITITTPSSPTTTVTGFAIGDSATFQWTITNGACPSSSSSMRVKRNNCPTTADFTANTTSECLNISPIVTFTDASVASGATIISWNWNFGAGAFPPTATGAGPHTVSYSTAGNKTVSLQVTDNLSATDFEIKAGFITITDVPNPSANVSGSTTVCQGQTGVAYSVPTIIGATGYTWSLPTGATIVSGINTNSVTMDFSSGAISGNISVTGTNACGSGTPSANFPVTINPLPSSAGSITGPASVCDGATGVTYSVASILNATSYSWSVPSGCVIMSGGTTNSITVNFLAGSAGGMITVNGVNSCGNGTSASINVTVDPYPGAADPIAGMTMITTCPSTSGVSYSIPLVANATSYNWTVPSGVNIVSGSGTNSILVDFTSGAVSGTIDVMPVNSCGTGTSSSISVTVNTMPDPAGTISGADTITVCPVSDSVTFSVPAIFNATNYVWTLPSGATIVAGDSTNTITVSFSGTAASGVIGVYGENACGSGTPSIIDIVVTPVPTQELCLVTVDNASNYNTVMWEKPAAGDIDSFRIYREILTSFVHIGSVAYDSLSSYVDSVYLPAANPNTTNFRYKISVIDTCGNESMLSNHHRTIFLQANLGVGGVVNLSWVPYEGATVDFYRILRDTLGGGPLIAIDSVPGSNTVWTDIAPAVLSTNVSYVLESNWSTVCTPTRATINTTRSNIKHVSMVSSGGVGIIEQEIMNNNISVYPNPANDHVTIEYPTGFKSYTLQLFDALGQLVVNEELPSDNTSGIILKHELNVSELQKGIYIVNVQTEYGSTFKRLVIQ